MNESVIKFGNLKSLPLGWCVIQLDSGHYIAMNDVEESCITVNRFHARKWSFQMAEKNKIAP